MTQELTTNQQNEQRKAMLAQMAQEAGEKQISFMSIPTITVFNNNPDKPSDTFSDGDLILSKKVDKEWINSKQLRPFYGIILKTRMMLKTKPAELKKGATMLISNEFDSYADSEEITIKRKDVDGSYVVDFIGSYKQIKENYTEILKSGAKSYPLELHHSIYVLTNIDNPQVVRIDSKGTSRSQFFDYMNSFDRSLGEHMIGYWTRFDTTVIENDWQGKALRFPVYAITFTREKEIPYADLLKVQAIQKEFNAQLAEMEAAFSKTKANKTISEGEQPARISDGVQPAPKDNYSQEIAEEIPVINIDDEDEVKLSDVPF